MIASSDAGQLFRKVIGGHGELRVEVISGASAVVKSRATSPLKILVPRPRGPSVWAYLSSYGGGLVAGDQIQINLGLGEHARCYLGTQASTKVYRNPGLRPCGHSLKAVLGEGSLLVLAPDRCRRFAAHSTGRGRNSICNGKAVW